MQTTYPEARTPDLFGNWACDECGEFIDELRYEESELRNPDTLILCDGYCLDQLKAEEWADYMRE